MRDHTGYYKEAGERISKLLAGTVDEFQRVTPSEWAESTRVLTRATTPVAGVFSWDATPYWKEVVDNLSPDSPTRFVAIMKGAQVAATVGVAETFVGYAIDYIKTEPLLFFSADAELAKMRLEENVLPMISASGMGHLIISNNDFQVGKQGATSKKLSWAGGGYLLPLGGINAAKMRSISAPLMVRDEIDAWPLNVGRDGDPMALTETRTNSYELNRKILDLSTPTLANTSAIEKRFMLGDQRYYMIPCKHCGKHQRLEFRGTTEDGLFYGLRWEMDDPLTVKPDTTRYVCRFCSGEMRNEDKIAIMGDGYWEPTAKPKIPHFRSYHVNALYAPFFARTWEAIAIAWVSAWDDENDTARNVEALKTFTNNDLGIPYVGSTDRMKAKEVRRHKIQDYKIGELPSDHPDRHAGGRIHAVTMAVDVQGSYLSVQIVGWAPSADRHGYAAYTLDYFEIEGSTELPDSDSWSKLGDIIDGRTYHDRGRAYPIIITLIDSSYRPDTVNDFCSQWEYGVFPLRGRDKPTKAAAFKEFSVRETTKGVRFIGAIVDIYKDRWSASLKREWNGVDKLHRNSWCAPSDLSDQYFKELTVEYKVNKTCPQSGKVLGTRWHRRQGAKNEAWDTLIYCTVALEMVALEHCQSSGLDHLDWQAFWNETQYYEEIK